MTMLSAPSTYITQMFNSSNKENNDMTSSLSSITATSDLNFIEFTRCLYKAKSVVQEIGIFSKTVKPTLIHEYFYDSNEFVSQVNNYLKESVDKFNHICKVLLLVLAKLESNQPSKKQRIDSFRQEVLSEREKVIQIRQDLLSIIDNRNYNHEVGNIPTSNDDLNSMMESDDEQESDTTIEPTTSSDSSDF